MCSGEVLVESWMVSVVGFGRAAHTTLLAMDLFFRKPTCGGDGNSSASLGLVSIRCQKSLSRVERDGRYGEKVVMSLGTLVLVWVFFLSEMCCFLWE